MKRLIVTDVDSTFFRQEVIELIAEHAGTRDEVAAVTERAMRGELDFAASLRERVATLAGVPVAALDKVRAAVELMPGARELVAECHARGWAFGLVSGGFAEIVEPIAQELGIDAAARQPAGGRRRRADRPDRRPRHRPGGQGRDAARVGRRAWTSRWSTRSPWATARTTSA